MIRTSWEKALSDVYDRTIVTDTWAYNAHVHTRTRPSGRTRHLSRGYAARGHARVSSHTHGGSGRMHCAHGHASGRRPAVSESEIWLPSAATRPVDNARTAAHGGFPRHNHASRCTGPAQATHRPSSEHQSTRESQQGRVSRGTRVECGSVRKEAEARVHRKIST